MQIQDQYFIYFLRFSLWNHPWIGFLGDFKSTLFSNKTDCLTFVLCEKINTKRELVNGT